MKGYFVVDCNSFYCSCERLFRPDLSTRPVIVLSSNDGCVVSRTTEAKALGIGMGAPYFEIRPLCEAHRVAVFSSNFELYTDMSHRIMTALAEYAELMEVYSIDEAFLHFEQMPSLAWATEMWSRIKREIGIPVSIGAGSTKTLSKLASKLAKKQGVYFWTTDDSQRFHTMPCDEVWGISKGLGKRLSQNRIITVEDFLSVPVGAIRGLLGVVGARIWHELQGQPCMELVPEAPIRKSLCSSRTFKSQTDSIEDLEAAIAEHSHRIGETLREEGHYAGVVTVILNTDRFRPEMPQHNPMGSVRLFEPTMTTQGILAAALTLLHELRTPEIAYRKAGVVVGEISDGRQIALWPEDTQRRQKSEAVCRAMDNANSLYGRHVVTLGLGPKEKVWLPGARQKSPRYVSSWDELPSVR